MNRVLSQRVKGGRSKSTRRTAENVEENVPIDLEISPKENLKTILSNVCCAQTTISSGRRLGHLNNLVKLLCTRDDVLDHISLSTLLTCLKPALVNDVKEVRAACIRVLRYLINDSESCQLFVELHVDFLVVKCLDISHFNEVERIQTLRLIRKIIHVMKCQTFTNSNIPRSLISCIISISSDGADERDRVYRTCLGVLCELAVTHPNLCVQYGGLLSLFRAIPECHLYPRICECVIMSIVHVINNLDSCNINIVLNLDPLFSSYTDLLVRRLRSDSDDNQIREDEMHFVACKTAIVSALRSWSGLTYINQGNGLYSFISALSVPNSTTIRGILSVLFELFYMPEPDWTDDFNLALKTANPSVFQDSWRLSNSFIASEARALLPLRCKTRVDILDTFTSVLLAIFLNRGLLENLVICAISTNSHASVSSCMLLGGILHLCGELLPQTGSLYDKENKISMHRECLPNLLKRATDVTKTKEERSAAVITASRLEEIKKIYNKNSVSYSLYLEELLFRSSQYTNDVEDIVFLDDPMTIASSQFSKMPTSSISRRSSTIHSGGGGSFSEGGDIPIVVQTSARKSRSISLIRDFAEERILAKIKDTQVLITKENKQWKWNAILSILNNTYENNMSKEYLYGITNNDSVHRFFKRLVYFYLPKSKLFSVIELAREGREDHNRDLVLAGCRLMRFLLKANSVESLTLLSSLVAQIVEHLTTETSSTGAYRKSGETAIGTTCTREYFLLLGAISSDNLGDRVLSTQSAYSYFNSLLTDTTHENIIKLLISSLQYSEYGQARDVLRTALKKCSEPCRLYATAFLRCLYRADVPEFVHWGTELISSMLSDQSNAVAMEALNILDELCDDPEYLKAVVNLAPSVLHMGERGAMLVCRFLAYPTKPSYLSDGTYLTKELDRWWVSARVKYVEQVEEMLHVSLTSYEKPTNGNAYVRRSNVKKSKCPVRLPAHLYGELAKYSSGCAVLQNQCIVLKLINLLNKELSELEKLLQSSKTICYQTSRKIKTHLLEIKSCVWGLAHICSTNEGFRLTRQYDVCKILVNLAERSKWYSLRGTCTYCLSIVAQTVKGVEQLAAYNWISVTQKAKRLSELTDEPSSDEVTNYQYSPSAFVRRSSSVKQPEKIVTLTKQHSVSTECIFTIGENKEEKIENDIAHSPKALLSVLNVTDNDLTPSNSLLTLRDTEKNTDFYGSRNLSFSRDMEKGDNNKLNSKCSSSNLIASSNTGITAMYNIREKFQERSASFSETLTSNMESVYNNDPVEMSVENISLAKYVGLSLPYNIFSLFTLNHDQIKGDIGIGSPLPHDELPFLIRNAMHKKHSDSKFLIASDNPDFKSYNESPYIDDLQNTQDNQKAIQDEVLKLVAKLGSSIGIRNHETALLTIKEKVPAVFNSVTVYNQVSDMLGMYNYRLTARRFIQELFHGMQMDELYVEAKLELDRYSHTGTSA